LATIGGINVTFGVDISKVEEGIRNMTASIKEFERKVNNIGIEGIVKGDPFKKTTKFLNAARENVDDVFKAWVSSSEVGVEGLNKAEQRVREIVTKLIADFRELSTAPKNLLGNVIGQFERVAAGRSSVALTEEGTAFMGKNDVKAIKERIDELTSLREEQRKALKGFADDLAKGLSVEEVKRRLEVFNKMFDTGLKQFRERYRQFGDQIKKSFELIDRLRAREGARVKSEDESPKLQRQYEERAKVAASAAEAEARLTKQVRELRLAEKALIKDIEAGNSVKENSARLLKVQNQLRERGQEVVLKDAGAMKQLVMAAKEENLERSATNLKRLNKERSKLADIIAKGNVSTSNVIRLEKLDNEINERKTRLVKDLKAQLRMLLKEYDKKNMTVAQANKIDRTRLQIQNLEIQGARKLATERKKLLATGLDVQYGPKTGAEKTKYQLELERLKSLSQAKRRLSVETDRLRKEQARLRADIALGNDVAAKAVQLRRVQTELMKRGTGVAREQADVMHGLIEDAKQEDRERRVEKLRKLTTERRKLVEVMQKGSVTIANLNRLEEIQVALNKKGAKFAKELAAEREKIMIQGLRRQPRTQLDREFFKAQLKVAGQHDQALGRRADILNELHLKERKLNADIRANIDAEQKRVELIKVYQEYKKLGMTYSREGIRLEKALTEEAVRRTRLKYEIPKKTSEDRAVLQERLRLAESYVQAQRRKANLVKELRIQEAALINDIKAGNNVRQKANELQKVQNQLLALNQLTLKKDLKARVATAKAIAAEKKEKRVENYKKLRVESRRLRAEMKRGIITKEAINRLEKIHNKLIRDKSFDLKKATKEVDRFRTKLKEREGKTGFLSASWFRARAGWFIQLRGFWALYRGITEGFRKVKELEQAMANLQAVTMATSGEMLVMSGALEKVAKSLNIDITTIADGMVKLGQAGLSAAEVTNAIQDVATLATATMTDMTTSADLVTTVMKAWREESDDTEHIVDVLASTVNRSKVQIKGLGTALQYLTGVAPQLNISLADTAGMIGMMANQGIKMSKVGTGLRSLLGELVKPSKRFEKELHKVGITLQDIDMSSGRNVIDILEQLKVAGFDATNAFRGLDRRAAAAIAALIGRASELRGFSDSLGSLGTAADMAAVQMDTLQSKLTKLGNTTVIVLEKIYSRYAPILKKMIDYMTEFVDGASDLAPPLKKILELLVGIGTTVGIIFAGSMIAKLLKIKEAFKATKHILTGLFVVLSKITKLKLGMFGVVAIIVWLIDYIANAKEGLASMEEALDRTTQKLNEQEAVLKKSEKTFEKYVKAIREGKNIEAERVIAKDQILLAMHLEGKELEEITEKHKELNKERREGIRLLKEETLEQKKKLLERKLRNVLLDKEEAERDVEFRKSTVSKAKNMINIYQRRVDKENVTIPGFGGRSLQNLNNWKNQLKIQTDALKSLRVKKAEFDLELVKIRTEIVAFMYDYIKFVGVGTKTTDELVNQFEDLAAAYNKYGRTTFKEMVDNINTKTKKDKEELDSLKKYKRAYLDAADAANIMSEVLEKGLMVPKNKALREYLEMRPEHKEILRKAMKEDFDLAYSTIQELAKELAKTDLEVTTKQKGFLMGWFGEKSPLVEEYRKKFTDARVTAIFDKIISKLEKKKIAKDSWIVQYNKWLRKTQADTESFGETTSRVQKEIIQANRYFKDALAKEEWKPRKGKIESERDKRINKIIGATRERIKLDIEALKLETEAIKGQDVYVTRQKKADADRAVAIRRLRKDYGGVVEITDAYLEKLAAINDKYNAIINKSKLEQKINKINVAAQQKIVELSTQQEALELFHPEKHVEILNLEKKKLEKRKEAILLILEENRLSEGAKLSGEELLRLTNELTQTEMELVRHADEYKKRMEWTYKIASSIKKKLSEWRDSFVDLIESEMVSGITDILNKITRGFEEQREEANQLQDELNQLEIDYQNAIADGQAEEAARIADEMNRLKGEINDLRNPIKNLGEVFKEFFLSLAKSIQDTINKWIAMKVVMGLLDLLPTKGGVGPSGFDPDMFPSSWSNKHGGVISPIRAFHRFSSGGLTSRDTMAILGDNASGRELVIPSENIDKNNVSGYVRESGQPINIVNVVTQEDIATAMTGKSGEKVVINHIGADLMKRGPIYRALRV